MTIFNKDKKFEKELFNNFWLFHKGIVADNSIEKDIGKYQKVTLPHDWLIDNNGDYYESSLGIYQKEFTLDISQEEEYFLYFEGVYQDSIYYINDQEAFVWKNGYSSHHFNITKYLKQGTNKVLVKIKHESPNSRWYSGAGIYRDVYLIKKQKSYININGLYVHTKKNNGLYNLEVDTKLTESKGLSLRHRLYDKDNLIANSENIELGNKDEQVFESLQVNEWSPNNPYLYKLITELIDNEIIVDQVITNIGFKDIKYDHDLGFFINDNQMKLNGVCEHHDLGSLGSAFNKEVLRNRMLLLKEMGVNAIRTAHSIPAKALMDLADELGFLVVTEAFDMWLLPKTEFDYARFFDEWLDKDVKSWITRDRNHVSLLMWSIGNEIYDTNIDENGFITAKRIVDLIYKYDYKRNAESTIGSNFMASEHAQKVSDLLKFVGYNYAENLYIDHKEKYPNWYIYGSETSSTLQSRGIYHFPLEEQRLINSDMQVSSLGNSTTSWGANSTNDVLTIDRDIKFSLGQFIWTGFDYIGEPTPYKTKNSYFGQIDTAGFAKDSFYAYQASWNKFDNKPVIHLLPYWNFNEGEIIDVRVVTNAPMFKLYLNDKLIAEEQTNILTDLDIYRSFKIPFEQGTLRAVAYDLNNNVVKESVRTSFKDSIKFKTSLNKETLVADNKDVLELTIETLDENDNLVQNDNANVEVILDGPIKLVGTDTGNSTELASYKSNVKKMFSGKLKVLIGSTYKEGSATITIKSKNLETKVINVYIAKANNLTSEDLIAINSNYNIRSGESNYNLDNNFIPVRTINIKKPETTLLTKDKSEVLIEYEILPKNYTNQDITFDVITSKGVISNVAILKETEGGLKLEALSDGNFILRIMANNEKEYPEIISTRNFTSENIGVTYKNPYIFNSASLYDSYEGLVKSGNELGVASDNNGSTLIYKGVNFGEKGTNLLTLPIFSFDSSPLEMELEISDNKSTYKQELSYFKQTVWDVYQSETYKLSEVIKGIKTLKIKFMRSVHFKGFEFKELDDSNLWHHINDASNYYGDNFNKHEEGFDSIGNNVSFIYDDYNFDLVNQITILGKANNETNNIRLKITNSDDNITLTDLSFKGSQSIEEQSFEIPEIIGRCKIEFIFLPGSDFNFRKFKFTRGE